jgi:hypothetical protein
MYCLARDCARDEVVRKFVAPALELIMLDKALRGEFDREKALLIFGEMYATAKRPRRRRFDHIGGGVAVKYNVYLRENAIELQFQSTDRSRVELAARL